MRPVAPLFGGLDGRSGLGRRSVPVSIAKPLKPPGVFEHHPPVSSRHQALSTVSCVVSSLSVSELRAHTGGAPAAPNSLPSPPSPPRRPAEPSACRARDDPGGLHHLGTGSRRPGGRVISGAARDDAAAETARDCSSHPPLRDNAGPLAPSWPARVIRRRYETARPMRNCKAQYLR